MRLAGRGKKADYPLMNIAFDEIIRNGVIALPERSRKQAEGRAAHVVITEEDKPDNSECGGWHDIIDKIVANPLPPFKPLSRDEANDRRL